MENQQSERLWAVAASDPVFSLKWQALLFISLIFIAVTSAMVFLNKNKQEAHFQDQRQLTEERYLRDVQVLLERNVNRLRHFARLIPELPTVIEGMVDGDGFLLQQALEPYWPMLQLDVGIDALGLYGLSGELLAGWEVSWEAARSRQALAWLRQVNAKGSPLIALSCLSECMHYAVLPVQVGEERVGVVLLGSTLAHMLLALRDLASEDVGLLVVGDAETVDEERWLASWQARVVALTNMQDNLPVLKTAAQGPLRQQRLRSTLGGRSYELYLLALPELVGANSAYLVVVDDITEALADIQGADNTIMMIGLSGWLLMAIGLLAWQPARLSAIAARLSLLAQGQFRKVREDAPKLPRPRLLRDEVDQLDAAIGQLSNDLERREVKIIEQNQDQSRRLEALVLEREAASRLVSTAQVMILTQNRLGQIMTVNPYVHSVSAYREAELVGKDFIEVFFQGGMPDLRWRLTQELATNKRSHLRHESLLSRKDGGIRNVIWCHSHWEGKALNNACILSVGVDITERRGVESRLAWIADHDVLTGLLNRRRFQEELEVMVRASQLQKTGALLLMELDQPSQATDGDVDADLRLKLVANALSSEGIAVDVVARLEENMFALLLREANSHQAAQLAAAINTILSYIRLANGEQLSACIGVVLFPTHGKTSPDVLASADLALYKARQAGIGQWHLFSEEDKTWERVRSRAYWQDQVSDSLSKDRFVLYYQPVIAVRDDHIALYKVLLRMLDENGAVISASHFIDAAERGAMIHAVDRLVISKAIQALAELDIEDIAFSISLSGHSFNDLRLLPHIRRELESHHVDPRKLIFELSEVAAISDFALSNSLMLSLKELGCGLALSRFGMGFSSFHHLRNLPADYVKIDGAFIRNLVENRDDQVVVQAISLAAVGFGKQTIAEHVETEATLDLLREYGIDYAQGYLIGRPQSAQKVFQLD